MRGRLTAGVDVHLREEESDFNGSCFRAVGAVNSVSVDRLSEVGSDGALGSLLRVGSAHEFTILHDGIFTFENLNLNGTGNHEVNQIFEEGAFTVNSVESFGFLAGKPLHFGSNNLEVVRFKAGVNLTDNVFGNCIGFNNLKCAFNSHFNLLKTKKVKNRNAEDSALLFV